MAARPGLSCFPLTKPSKPKGPVPSDGFTLATIALSGVGAPFAPCYFRRVQTACVHCGLQHVLRDDQIGLHPKVQFHCSKCGKTTVVEIKRKAPDATMVISPLPSFARSDASSSSLRLPPQDDGLKLPAAASVVLTVVSGPSKGVKHKLTKARVVVGRQGADIALLDKEISRHHVLLEVRENFINLKDLDSTNGTFYEEERVRAAMLQNGAEFRIGESTLRITFEPK
jgi:Inner membrane component of T3SS, cytoplasmic domain